MEGHRQLQRPGVSQKIGQNLSWRDMVWVMGKCITLVVLALSIITFRTRITC